MVTIVVIIVIAMYDKEKLLCLVVGFKIKMETFCELPIWGKIPSCPKTLNWNKIQHNISVINLFVGLLNRYLEDTRKSYLAVYNELEERIVIGKCIYKSNKYRVLIGSYVPEITSNDYHDIQNDLNDFLGSCEVSHMYIINTM